ncbi:hypothetical protein Tco_0538383 [Tanacetum coccineum]
MYTRGRKKAEAEPAAPARDPRDVETIERLYRDDPIRSLGLKIKIPEFTGKVHPDDFIDWLSTIERVFDVRDIPNKLKVKLVAIKLRQHASLWWDHVNKRRQIKGKSKNITVEEVINEFDKLRMRCDVVEEEEQVVARFLGVLKPGIADIAKSKGSTSRFTPPTRTAPPTAPKTAPKATTLTTSAAESEVDEPGDELVYPDRGEALVIQRVLNVVVLNSVDDNLWLRNNIFRTNYKEEVWCEVILMDATHILLGRPWQFDRKTKHDGFQNTYSFKKDGVNITLVPFDSLIEENKIISEAPTQVQPFLREFADVKPDDIPPGLPAMRNIQHCIDFIPGFAIPNVTPPKSGHSGKVSSRVRRALSSRLRLQHLKKVRVQRKDAEISSGFVLMKRCRSYKYKEISRTKALAVKENERKELFNQQNERKKSCSKGRFSKVTRMR